VPAVLTPHVPCDTISFTIPKNLHKDVPMRQVFASRCCATLLILFAIACSGARADQNSDQSAVEFTKVYELKPSEGVFAYSRISPDGRFLAYASEGLTNGRIATVVELATKKVLYTDRGIDPYFSHDGKRMIYLAQPAGGRSSVVIRHHDTGALTRDVAPTGLGDYYSWAVRDGKNLILTIFGNYYYLDGDKGVMPHSAVTACPGIGAGDRPLISKDGRRITTFVRGNVIVRGLDNCDDVIDTGIEGGKADFSFDGRYIATHAPRANGGGYDIMVVDLKDRTVRNITSSLAGSSLFPSWTEDGRLSFRYDGADYRGFMFASNVLSASTSPLPRAGGRLADARRDWTDVFPETPQPKNRAAVVLVWGSWSAHAPDALTDLQRAAAHFRERGYDIGVMTATDPGSFETDVVSMLQRSNISIPRIPLAPQRLVLTEMHNQNPTTLLFRDGRFVDRRMGAQSYEQLMEWVK
jgi:hypothetical protein